MQLPVDGSFKDFRFAEIDRTPPAAGQVEIAVHSAGLNFRDVLRAPARRKSTSGRSASLADLAPFGFECAVVTAVGPNVTHLKVGDEVLAISGRERSAHTVLETGHVAVKPQNLSMTRSRRSRSAFLTASCMASKTSPSCSRATVC